MKPVRKAGVQMRTPLQGKAMVMLEGLTKHVVTILEGAAPEDRLEFLDRISDGFCGECGLDECVKAHPIGPSLTVELMLPADVKENLGIGNTANKPGWHTVAMDDASGRRGLWYRRDPPYRDGTNNPFIKSPSPRIVEICAGREGDDAWVKLEAGKRISQSQLIALLDCLERQAICYEAKE